MADRSFLGTGMKFPPEVDKATGRFVTVSANDSVREAVFLILMTQRTERLTRPGFGSDLMDYAFMDTSTTMLSILRRDLTETLMAQEPRIMDIDIETEYLEKQGCIVINIDYTVRENNTRDNLVFPFYLNIEAVPEEVEPDLPNQDIYDIFEEFYQ